MALFLFLFTITSSGVKNFDISYSPLMLIVTGWLYQVYPMIEAPIALRESPLGDLAFCI
jgi:hypothetical protein